MLLFSHGKDTGVCMAEQGKVVRNGSQQTCSRARVPLGELVSPANTSSSVALKLMYICMMCMCVCHSSPVLVVFLFNGLEDAEFRDLTTRPWLRSSLRPSRSCTHIVTFFYFFIRQRAVSTADYPAGARRGNSQTWHE